MWRLTTILAIVLASTNANGQGKILFGNDSAHLFVLYGNPLPVSPLPSGHTLKAVLYAGTAAGSLLLQTSVVLDASGWLEPGRMANKTVILANVPGGTAAYFQIFVTDTGAVLPGTIIGNQSYYFAGATYFGSSGLFTAIPGTGLAFPSLATAASASTWAAGSIEAAGGCLGCSPPWFLTNPSNKVVRLGDNVSLTTSVSNLPIFSVVYQWRKQGSPIAGATNSYLTLTNVTLADAGNYDVVAGNFFGTPPLNYGSAVSAVATVTVLVPAQLGSPTYTANNQFQFTVTGAPGTNYVVQVSTNLSFPDWLSILTNPAPFTFVDSNAQSFPQRFYRAYSP